MDFNVKTILPEDRDAYGQYMIDPSTIHVFPFTIPLLQGLKVSAIHIYPNSQDMTICMWISSSPFDGLELEQGFGHFRPNRRTTEFQIFDTFLKRNQEDDRLFLSSGQTYYLNVKNLQNRQNAYQLYLDNFSPAP